MTLDGTAIVYCEGAFDAPNGKTAHGLVRFTRRYRVASVIDSRHADCDAAWILDGYPAGIPVHDSVENALMATAAATHLVIGLAPDGGRLPDSARADVRRAVELGLNVDAGLHDFLGEDPEIAALAKKAGVTIRDVRRPPDRNDLHFFTGKIEEVDCLKIAVLGTDSAVGKRTTAWKIVEGFEAAGHRAEMVGTGQTAWMQGARFTTIMDSVVNDFVAGEIEHAVWRAWKEARPEAIVIEGQGGLMNPAYPGGFEILAAGRPDVVVLQHAPARRDYDGFPGYRIQPLGRQIEAIELISGRPVVALTLNHEDLPLDRVPMVCTTVAALTGLPTSDVLLEGPGPLVEALTPFLKTA